MNVRISLPLAYTIAFNERRKDHSSGSDRDADDVYFRTLPRSRERQELPQSLLCGSFQLFHVVVADSLSCGRRRWP